MKEGGLLETHFLNCGGKLPSEEASAAAAAATAPNERTRKHTHVEVLRLHCLAVGRARQEDCGSARSSALRSLAISLASRCIAPGQLTLAALCITLAHEGQQKGELHRRERKRGRWRCERAG
ncbi:hypothetical protein FA09DRAFT_136186 [Tilletiopsis washingtonensis]|uniref:Uncharacterized protein n=1 Tax=Tilletiopsis washingtonensis TaxID=58919 RepID=A0A316Z618_9BASI|nr:hypothetical protein FA09DRAFT_136186 [Tilletiopsis washingtonensis]PWN95655.1 hypothetical protein FA09DRAFT_136186 [Tilletiopsis washingtonensis]